MDFPLWAPRKGQDGPAAAAARAAALAAQEREYRRLLYVALTRAEDRLYVCGWEMQKRAPAGCWYDLVQGALSGVGEAVEFDFGDPASGGWSGPGWRLSQPQRADADKRERTADGPEAEIAPLPPWARAAPPPETAPPKPLAPSRPAQPEPATLSPLGPDRGRRFARGRLIHRLLQHLPEVPAEQRRAAAGRFLAGAAPELGAEARAEVAEAALAVLVNPEFAPLFGPGSRAEVPVVGLVGAGPARQVVSGQIDRLVVGESRVQIVDYKSNRPAPRREAEVSPLYLRQMAAYRAVLAGVYPDHRIDCLLLWSDGPFLMQLSDASLAAHEP